MSYLVVTALGVLNLCSFACYSLVLPFLPTELAKLGLGIDLIGYIFAVFSIAGLVGSPLVGHMMGTIGRRLVLVIGLFLMGVSMFFYGLLP